MYLNSLSKIMAQKELIKVFKYIVKKCDMLINNDDYEADAYTQDTVEDIAELCNHILDGDYGKLVELKEVDLEKVFNDEYSKFSNNVDATDYSFPIDLADYEDFAKHFFELGLKAKG